MDTKVTGNRGEDLACEYLVEKGYKILGRNWRIAFGELDIIARPKGNIFTQRYKPIHFVEVKSLQYQSKDFFPEEHVNFTKQRKLKQLSQLWLQKHGFPQSYPHQIDIVAVTLEPYSLTFFENVASGEV